MNPVRPVTKLRDRDTLKSYFADGRMPSGSHFNELIESTLNMHDEGFTKTPDSGLNIATAVGKQTLVTFYRGEDTQSGLWSVRFGGGEGEPLVLGPEPALRRQAAAGAAAGAGPGAGPGAAPVKATPEGTGPTISLHPAGRVGIGVDQPLHTLDVAGMVAARGRIGTFPLLAKDKRRADGVWHPLTGELHGCVALEVVAAVGTAGSGRHAVLHAMALNAHSPALGRTLGWLARRFPSWDLERRLNRRNRIRSQTAWYGERCDQLQLRWVGQGEGQPYWLEVRTRCAYPDPAPVIDVHVSQLWPTEPLIPNALPPVACARARA